MSTATGPSSPRRRGPCRHCHRVVSLLPRGLCHPCYEDPEIRCRHPSRLRSRRTWTRLDEQRLRAARSQVPPVPWKVLARQLGYAHWRSLATQAGRRGIPVRRRRPPVDVEHLQRLVEAGHSRRETARLLGCGEGAVDYHCTRLGLHTRGRHAARTEQRKRHLSQVCKANGWRSLGEASAEHGRIQAALMGWPEAEGVLPARILQSLLERGPLCRRELAECLGHKLDYLGRAGHYLSQAVTTLDRRGLIVIVGFRSTRGRGAALYDLAPAKPRTRKEPRRERTH